MSLNTFFDRIYCINLNHRLDRWQESIEEFKKHKLIVDRFPAATSNHPIVPSGYVGWNNKIERNVRDGEAGLIASHILIFNDALNNGYKNFLILEDDVEFDDDLNNKFDKWVKDLPEEWDILYLGGNYPSIQPKKFKNNIYLCHKTYTTHAIGFNSKSFGKILSRINYNVPIDVNYAEQSNDLYAFTFRPHLAWQRTSYSDINHQVTNYSFLKG